MECFLFSPQNIGILLCCLENCLTRLEERRYGKLDPDDALPPNANSNLTEPRNSWCPHTVLWQWKAPDFSHGQRHAPVCEFPSILSSVAPALGVLVRLRLTGRAFVFFLREGALFSGVYHEPTLCCGCSLFLFFLTIYSSSLMMINKWYIIRDDLSPAGFCQLRQRSARSREVVPGSSPVWFVRLLDCCLNYGCNMFWINYCFQRFYFKGR